MSKSVDEFIDSFCEKVELLPHSFVATQQVAYHTKLKADLKCGEFITTDFSENYMFVLQDAAQGFHWKHSKSTINPFVAYRKHEGELKHLCYVIII